MQSKITNTILSVLFLFGLSLLLYPSISDYYNSFHQTKAITSYSEKVSRLKTNEYEKMLKEAKDFNSDLQKRSNIFHLTGEQKTKYSNLLNISGMGIMGYIEIPKINCSLPIYHGTSDEVLQVAIGHLPWSSLPTSGKGNHTIISGHRGLPSAKLFTDLDKLDVGDIFIIRVLNEVFTYEVDNISIIKPNQIETLKFYKDKDLFTLITCTPYGVNTHRLLVRGYRIDNLPQSKNIKITGDVIQLEPIIIAPIISIPLLFILVLYVLIKYRKKKFEKGD